MSAKQNLLSPWPAFLVRFLPFFVFCLGVTLPAHGDALEDAARLLADKVIAVPSGEHPFRLVWRNHSYISDADLQKLKISFLNAVGNHAISESADGVPPLTISIEEKPSRVLLVAEVPSASGAEIRMVELPRPLLAVKQQSKSGYHLQKKLIWEQQAPILSAIEHIGASSNGTFPGNGDGNNTKENNWDFLLILGSDSLTLYRRDAEDHWTIKNAKRILAGNLASRDARGLILFSPEREGQARIELSGKVCDVNLADGLTLNCQPGAETSTGRILLTSRCDASTWWLRGDVGDWSTPDRLAIRSAVPSAEQTGGISVADIDMPGPVLSVASGQGLQADTVVVFNLASGNYEVYRITIACGD